MCQVFEDNPDEYRPDVRRDGHEGANVVGADFAPVDGDAERGGRELADFLCRLYSGVTFVSYLVPQSISVMNSVPSKSMIFAFVMFAHFGKFLNADDRIVALIDQLIHIDHLTRAMPSRTISIASTSRRRRRTKCERTT